MSSFMNKSLALFVILCVMAPSIWIDARAIHTDAEVFSHLTQRSKKSGSSHENTGDSTQSSMSYQDGEDSTKPSGSSSQDDSSEKTDGDSKKKKKHQKKKHSQEQSGDSTQPTESSSRDDSSEQTDEDPKKKGKSSQEQSGGALNSSDQSASSDQSSANTTTSASSKGSQTGGSRTSTTRATTLHATGHHIGKRPSDSWLSAHPAEKSNDDVQAAECAHNLRTHSQNFAYFKIDPSKANNHGAPYGTCYAVSTAPEESELVADAGYDVFFWNNMGGESGVGTGPIRNSETGVAGYEDTEGRHFDGENPDKSP
ncbi:hypothetical protein DFH28DRAFT_975981 [Melampsora americana]|nr:hypothetical protein DFH28DRAFT_975981 [Melampsora americana]